MELKEMMNKLLDATIFFSFDRSGYRRHCPEPLQLVDLTGQRGLVTGASKGIGWAVANKLIGQGMQTILIARETSSIKNLLPPEKATLSTSFDLDLSLLKKVYAFAQDQVTQPLDVLVHNAGSMPDQLTLTSEGIELCFALQVLAPFILTKTLAEQGKLAKNCRIIFVSSGGMYLKKLDLSDLTYSHTKYNKYSCYANVKRAQVILAKQFASRYPDYLFSAMHPGWVKTAGVEQAMPTFNKLLNKRLRLPEQGADTILWLATGQKYENGQFWFDRKRAPTTFFHCNRSSLEDKQKLWQLCENQLERLKLESL